MEKRDVIVVGASAGGVNALQRLVHGLPPKLQASIFIVLHLPDQCTSALPAVLGNVSPLPAMHPSSDQPIKRGHIYIAPPGYHLILEPDLVKLWRGPRENRQRPAIDVLFRSAAISYRERVAGVVLTGTLDDGSAGLSWIKHYGGATIVQEPSEALFSDMPRNAIARVNVDYISRVEDMGTLLAALAIGTAFKVGRGGGFSWTVSNPL